MISDKPQFKDHFSGHAREYATYRPSYPNALYDWLGQISTERMTAWDCATGNGQAAVGLKAYFQNVIATDASSKQLKETGHQPGISYRVEPAERCSLADTSVDLISVGQAYHWFDHSAFLAESIRVLKSGGVLAIWTYKLATIEPAIDAVVLKLYENIVGDYWPPERKYIDRDYQDFNFPWPEITVPEFTMRVCWNLDALKGYLGTWSACRRYVQDNNADPLRLIEDELRDAWGDPRLEKRVTWPLIVRAFRKSG